MTPLQTLKHHRREARKAAAEIAEIKGVGRQRDLEENASAAARFISGKNGLGAKIARGDGDPEDLRLLLALRAEVEAALTEATEGLLDQGRSFTEIASALGISRQAARQRYRRHAA